MKTIKHNIPSQQTKDLHTFTTNTRPMYIPPQQTQDLHAFTTNTRPTYLHK